MPPIDRNFPKIIPGFNVILLTDITLSTSVKPCPKKKLLKHDVMASLLTSIIVDRTQPLNLTPALLFSVMNLSKQAIETIQQHEQIIPQELMESLTEEFLLELNLS
jgi:hypothetical protein